MGDAWLNVAAIRRRSRVNGPGLRNAVWVQGCSIRCPGCFNPDTHPHERRTLFDPVRLAEQLAGEDGIDGVTLLGGEPFEQADACARFARRARALGASVVTYSGYTYASLRAARLPEVRELLEATDLLIAGPFVQGRAHDGRGWHGSTNQEFVFLTDRYDDRVRAQFDQVPVVEARADGAVVDWTGIPAGIDCSVLEARVPAGGPGEGAHLGSAACPVSQARRSGRGERV